MALKKFPSAHQVADDNSLRIRERATKGLWIVVITLGRVYCPGFTAHQPCQL